MEAEATQQDKERLYVLLARYQLGLLSDAEKAEMNGLQKKVYGDSTLYREAEFEKLACDPKKGDNYMPAEAEGAKDATGAKPPDDGDDDDKNDEPRIIEINDKESETERAAEELFGESSEAPAEKADEKKKRKLELDVEDIGL